MIPFHLYSRRTLPKVRQLLFISPHPQIIFVFLQAEHWIVQENSHLLQSISKSVFIPNMCHLALIGDKPLLRGSLVRGVNQQLLRRDQLLLRINVLGRPSYLAVRGTGLLDVFRSIAGRLLGMIGRSAVLTVFICRKGNGLARSLIICFMGGRSFVALRSICPRSELCEQGFRVFVGSNAVGEFCSLAGHCGKNFDAIQTQTMNM